MHHFGPLELYLPSQPSTTLLFSSRASVNHDDLSRDNRNPMTLRQASFTGLTVFKAAADIICKDGKRAAAQRRLEREESTNTEDLGFSSHVIAGSAAHVSALSSSSSSKVSPAEGSDAEGDHAGVEPGSVAISDEDVGILDPEASAYDPSVASPGRRTMKSGRPASCSEDEESSSRDGEGEEGLNEV